MFAASKWSFSVLGAVYVLSLISHIQAQSQDGTCVITETSCACSQTISSGVCMQHKGDGKCVLGPCKPSYRCDCMGYEMCTRSKCALYTAKENALPSETTPFGCHLTIDAGTCTRFDYVMDSVAAVNNMQTEVSGLNEAILDANLEVYETVAAIEADVIVMNNALKEMDEMRLEMSAEEVEQIEKDADGGMETVEKGSRVALGASEDARKVHTWWRGVARLAAQARKAQRDAEKTEKRLKAEQKRAEQDGTECGACAGLRDEVDRLRSESKSAVIAAGQVAKQAREDSTNGRAKLDKIKQLGLQSDEGRGRVVAAVQAVKRRTGGR